MNTQELPTTQRWFAIECNNVAWDLASQTKRSTDEDLQMFDAAHASAYHWSEVGEAINHARADMLLAHVHSLLGEGSNALFYGKRALEFCQHNQCDDMDLPFALSEVAFAHFVMKHPSEHLNYYEEAVESGKKIEDQIDHQIFLSEFTRIPIPAPI